MVLAIDASRAAEPQKTGVGWYCHHLLANLKDVIPHDVRVILYTDQPLPAELRPWPAHWKERVLKRRGPMWSQIVLANAVLRDRPDVFFVPAHVIPLVLALVPRARRPRPVTTIHDVVFKEFPESYALRERWYADHATRLAVRHADRIIVPTGAVKQDLERYYRCASERVTVIYHGVEHSNATNADSNTSNFELDHLPDLKHLNEIRSIRMFPERFILYMGRLERKKNVTRMVEAFDRIAEHHQDIRLVLAGPPGHGYEEVRTAIERSPFRDRIVTPGWVDDAQRQQLLQRATVFLFPTLGEGFGLPILEAMAAGVPVITSRSGAHEEVAGDAAVLIDPLDTNAIADAIERVLTDQHLRTDLVRRGKQRAMKFTWQRSAQQTWDVLSS